MRDPSSFEFEDVLSDQRRAEDGSDGGPHREMPVRRHSLRVALYVVWGVLALFALKAYSLTVLEGSLFSDVAEQSRQRESILTPPRGAILDHEGITLVENAPSFVLLFDPLAAKGLSESDFQYALSKTAELVRVPERQIAERIAPYKNQSEPRIIEADVSQEHAVAFSVSDIPNAFRVEPAYRRTYSADARYFAPVLGYVGLMNDEEASRHPDLKPRESIGKAGVEEQYDGILRGKPGIRTVLVDAHGVPHRESVTQQPVAGKTIQLSIDAALTKTLGIALEKQMRSVGAGAAAAVAVDPHDGSVRAMVSLPTYDPEALSRGLTEAEYQKLVSNSYSPFLNRAIAGIYPSGSTIKPFIGAAALAEHVITSTKKIDDTEGFITVQSIYDPDVSWTFRDWKPHGFVNLIDAIARSADVYFYEVGGGYHDLEGLGVTRIVRYLEAFGFGETLGVDLRGEQGGRVPTPAWKSQTLHEQWYIGDTYNLSIGQGAFGATPLQLAVATAAIANGGHLYVPHVLDAIRDFGGMKSEIIEPKTLRDVPVLESDLAIIRRGMRAAVTESYGTNKMLASLPLTSAAKTGTAQFGNGKKTHAWVTAFAPYEHPTLTLAIIVEGGGEGTVATEVAKEVLEWYAAHRSN